MEMERSLTSTLKTTPFSINDILTKNNTTIFRRCSSSGHLSPIDRKSAHGSECDEPSDELSQHLANSMRFFKYSPHNYEHDPNIDQSSMRHSAQNYLFNNNNHSEKMLSANDMKHKRGTSAEKTPKSMKYYNFPLMFERPLDMRRCADGDDSGENPFIFHCFVGILIKVFGIISGALKYSKCWIPWQQLEQRENIFFHILQHVPNASQLIVSIWTFIHSRTSFSQRWKTISCPKTEIFFCILFNGCNCAYLPNGLESKHRQN